MDSSVCYALDLKASKKEFRTGTAGQLVRLLLDRYGSAQTYEVYTDATEGTLVFDVDGDARNTDAATLQAAALVGIDTFLGGLPAHNMLTATAHGDPDAGSHKLSFRFFLPDYRMKMSHVKARMERLGLDKNRPFDAAIYGKTQKLRLPGSIKTASDRRPLMLVDRDGSYLREPTAELLLDCIVQVPRENAQLLHEPALATIDKYANKKTRREQASSSPDWQNRVKPGCRKATEDALRRAGFRGISWLNDRNQTFTFSCDRSTPCPCCGNSHARQQWWVICMLQPVWYVVMLLAQQQTSRDFCCEAT